MNERVAIFWRRVLTRFLTLIIAMWVLNLSNGWGREVQIAVAQVFIVAVVVWSIADTAALLFFDVVFAVCDAAREGYSIWKEWRHVSTGASNKAADADAQYD